MRVEDNKFTNCAVYEMFKINLLWQTQIPVVSANNINQQ